MLSDVLVLYLLVIPPTSCITLTTLIRWHTSTWTSDMKQMPYKTTLKIPEVQELRKKAAVLLVEKDLKPTFVRKKTWGKKILCTCRYHFAKMMYGWKKCCISSKTKYKKSRKKTQTLFFNWAELFQDFTMFTIIFINIL